MINIKVFIILGSGHMKDWSGLVGFAFTSPNGLVEKKVSVKGAFSQILAYFEVCH